MNYKKYEKYKDSTEEWIGIVPETWQVEPIREFYDYRSEKVSDKVYEPLSVTKQGILPQLEHAAKTDNNDNRKKVKKGDFVINSRSDRKGSCGVSPYEGSVSLIYHVLNSKDSSMNRYAHHLFRSQMFAEEFYKWGHGIVDDLWSTRWDEMKKIKIPMPPKEERLKIGIFLDKKTKHINEQISSNKKLLELLEEKKTTIINQSITKGLNPEAPMKNSGVEWIGEIPENWDVVPFKRLFDNIKDGTHGSFQRVSEGQPLLSAKNVFNDGIHISENESLISVEDYYSIISNGFPKKYDLLLTIVGTIGRSCVYEKDYALAFQRSVAFIRLTQDNPYFYHYVIKSNIFHSQLMIKAKESAQKGVYLNDIKECLVIRPPIEIQTEISDYLSKRVVKINKTITNIEENIELLEEYKTSLIHNVVTGKIDVREEVV